MSALESWFAPAVAEPLPARRPRRAPERPARARTQARAPRRHVHRRVRAHIVWMVLFALLLVGVVAMNVAVLRANVSVNQLDQEIAHKRALNQLLASELSAKRSAPQVEAAAHRLGLVQAQATDTGYLDLRHP
ncbi:MAG TPA: hypothetical protein VFA37_09845 [Gaiellaceae bacterium]|nr:hypothetical protein [Gaiellaceae bacterium]